jgi:signal transduction histidine kinase
MRWKLKNQGPPSRNPFVYSLRARVTAAILSPLIIILGTFMLMQYQLQKKMVMENLTLLASQTALTIEYSLQQAMLNHNRKDLQEILDSIGQNKMLRGIYLIDPFGRIVFSPFSRQVGTTLTNEDDTCVVCHQMSPEKRPVSVVVTLPGGERFFRSMNPIQNKPECQECHKDSERITGVLMTDISIAPLEASLRMDMWQHLILWGAAILVSVLIVNLVMDRFILQRMEALSTAIQKLGGGQHLSPLPENQTDEIGQVSQAFNQMVRQIETREIENKRLSDDLQRQSRERGELLKRVITAQEDERIRIARELHDEMGQALAVLALQMELANKCVGSKPEQAKNILEQSQNLVEDTTEQMYNMILALRPSDLDDLGLAVALKSHAERVLRGSGIHFHMDSTRLPNRLPPDLETVLYRVFQEALTNTFRHSRARQVSIILAKENGHVIGEIKDDGQGFDPKELCGDLNRPQGLGLAGMQERVLQHNGEVEIWSHPGQGTRINIRIPVMEVSDG